MPSASCVKLQLDKKVVNFPGIDIKLALEQAYQFCQSEADFKNITHETYDFMRSIAVVLAETDTPYYIINDSVASAAVVSPRIEPLTPIAEAATAGKSDSETVSKMAYFSGMLEVEFQAGQKYVYFVGPDFYDEMAAAPSKGKYVWEKLRGKTPGLVYPRGPKKTPGGVGGSIVSYAKVGGKFTSGETAQPKISLKRHKKFFLAKHALKKLVFLEPKGITGKLGQKVREVTTKRKIKKTKKLLLKPNIDFDDYDNCYYLDFDEVVVNDAFIDLVKWVLANGLTKDEEEAKIIAAKIINSKRGKSKGKDDKSKEKAKKTFTKAGQILDKQRKVREKQKAQKLKEKKQLTIKESLKQREKRLREAEKNLGSWSRNVTLKKPLKNIKKLVKTAENKEELKRLQTILDIRMLDYHDKKNIASISDIHENLEIHKYVSITANSISIRNVDEAYKKVAQGKWKDLVGIELYRYITDDSSNDDDPDEVPAQYKSVGWTAPNRQVGGEYSPKHNHIRLNVKKIAWRIAHVTYHEFGHSVWLVGLEKKDKFDYEILHQEFKNALDFNGVSKIRTKDLNQEQRLLMYQYNKPTEFFAIQFQKAVQKQKLTDLTDEVGGIEKYFNRVLKKYASISN